jgi:hypothetical protein
VGFGRDGAVAALQAREAGGSVIAVFWRSHFRLGVFALDNPKDVLAAVLTANDDIELSRMPKTVDAKSRA